MKPYATGKRWTLYHGDCLALLPDLGPTDAVITDPPYSSGGMVRGDRMGSTRKKYAGTDSEAAEYVPEFTGDNRDQRSFLTWCTLWLSMAFNIAVSGSPLVCFSDWRQLPTITDAI